VSGRESKTLAEATADELIAELRARSDAYAIGLIVGGEKGMFRIHCGGSLMACRGLAAQVNRNAAQYVEGSLVSPKPEDKG
jgi:hypothetical protein